ncbi:MAG: hypothetical protein A2901_07235 [Elusimicrobia bacterium RIFCSPLOWO2_01_FULL_54_10]|nr:MAG: hypothetical protein A2901_07235 [Elusimicrobia bacterium RIFCSPLOWO2_01_FULL_54_10]
MVRIIKLAGPVLFFALLAGLFLSLLLEGGDPDYYWRLKHGEMLVKEHLFPMKETFSFTANGTRMQVNAWLTEILFYLIHRSFGYLGQALFHCFLLTATHLLLYLFLTRRILLPTFGSAALTGLCALIFFNVAAPRAQNISFLFFLLSLFAVAEWEKGNEKAPYWIALGIFPWVNFHSGFMIAFVLLALIGVGKIIHDRRLSVSAFCPLLAGILFSLINPEGYQVYAFPAISMVNPTILNLINEMKPLNILDPMRFYPYLAMLILIMLYGVKSFASRRFPWALLCFALIYQSMTVLRMAPFFAIVSAICIGFSLKSSGDDKSLRIIFIVLSLFVGGMALRHVHPRMLNIYPWNEKSIHRKYPEESVRLIREKYPGKNIFNDFGWGGYLIYHLPENRIAIDSRTLPYLEFMEYGYNSVIWATPRAAWVLDEIKADLVLYPTPSLLVRYLDGHKDWERVLQTPTESLFVRKNIKARHI